MDMPSPKGTNCAMNTCLARSPGAMLAWPAYTSLRATIDSGIDTTASSATRICSPGANERCPPASNDRRNATGAPGEIAISTMPMSAARGRSKARVTTIARAGTAISTAKSPLATSPGCRQSQRNSPTTIPHPKVSMTVKTVAAAAIVRRFSGIGPLIGIGGL